LAAEVAAVGDRHAQITDQAAMAVAERLEFHWLKATLRQMRVAAGIILLGCAYVLAGCGTSESDQVRAKVDQFATASAAKDYMTICDQVLAPSLLAHLSAAGVTCREAMQIALGNVQNPTISIGRIRVAGRRASVITLSAARGEQASLESIDLIKTSKGWRLLSLGSPLTAGQVR
jgi:hypothetical protein